MEVRGSLFQFYILTGTSAEAENKSSADGGEEQSTTSPFLGDVATEDGVFAHS
jgi:hypothetical protein